MKRESLYLEIGNIDDDLIEAACAQRKSKKGRINFARFVGAAACFCIICIAAFSAFQKDSIYFNEIEVSSASKVKIPSDENTTVITPNYEELFDYYGITKFPDTLACMQRIEQKSYFIYQNLGGIIYDTNFLQYMSFDGKQTLTVAIAKEEFDIQTEDAKLSKIYGVPLTMGVSDGSAQPTYFAEVCIREVYLHITARGVDESAFVDIIREIIKLQN
ncbi:MAG: hypothetical protein IJ002_07490 [Clostridia bacterium]|nr:hypothetical protein [Clostridia bacterium]